MSIKPVIVIKPMEIVMGPKLLFFTRAYPCTLYTIDMYSLLFLHVIEYVYGLVIMFLWEQFSHISSLLVKCPSCSQ